MLTTRTGPQRNLGKRSSWYLLNILPPTRLLGAQTSGGIFEEMLVSGLPDSRQQKPVPLLYFSFPKAKVRYVRFEMLDFWGTGGGLQFFEVTSGERIFFFFFFFFFYIFAIISTL